eukprot:scaffold112080_cov13-Tisochrysis_lutea.AAC.1
MSKHIKGRSGKSCRLRCALLGRNVVVRDRTCCGDFIRSVGMRSAGAGGWTCSCCSLVWLNVEPTTAVLLLAAMRCIQHSLVR